MKRRLGCLSRGGLIAAGASLAVILVVALVFGGRLFSPGALNAQQGEEALGGVHSHAEIGGRCSACHAAFWSGEEMGDRCLACHVEIGSRLPDRESLHGALRGDADRFPCQDCHTEHGGEVGPLTAVDPETFPHQSTGYALDAHGQHLDGREFACADCHGPDLTRFDPATCADCHRDLDAAYVEVHVAAFGSECLACHDGIDSYGRGFDHDRMAFALEGKHQVQDCAECHGGARSIAELQAAPQDCFSCHAGDDAHGGQFGPDCAGCHTPEGWEGAVFDHSLAAFTLTGRHLEVKCRACHAGGIYRGTPQECSSCHEGDDAHDGQLGPDCATCHTAEGWEGAAFDHSLATFPLTGRHQDVACRECHADGVYRGTPKECFACHREDDAHDGQLGPDCAGCHTPVGWEGATFDHSLAAFPLTGRHEEVECSECHTSGTYRGTPQECFSCHEGDDAHAGQFGPDCAGCHTPEGWEEAIFDHSRATFPLTGRHQQVECRACHAEGVYRGTPQECFTCHREDDAHDGQFGPGCAQCHTSDGWEQVTFDHNRTAFGLQGAHTRVPCLQCHSGGAFRGTPSECAGCHDDPVYHAGLLGTTCTECHIPDGWTPARYGRPHTFPLGHGEAGPSPCRTCHPDRLATYTCYGCHEHEPPQIEEEHREEGIADLQGCAGCHPTGQKEEGESGDD